MGKLWHFDIPLLRSKYQLDTFIETGCGVGDALRHNAPLGFKKLFSCDMMYNLACHVRSSFASDTRIQIFTAESLLFLPHAISRAQGNVLFWLDAHFPGADYLGVGYLAEPDRMRALPLEQELRVIRHLRPTCGDVVLIDDRRIYEDGPFGSGNWPLRSHFGANGIGFIGHLFANSHIIVRDYADEGYIALIPKGNTG